jgi:uncharacterized membrane protein YecN with MAPEG domain
MAIPVITLLVTSVLIGIQIVLTAIVIKARRGSQIAVGSDGVPYLERAVRAHGNFIEVTPIFLISLLLLELVNSYLWWVAILGLVFSVGRVLHARSLLVTELRSGSYRQRVLGMMLTMIALTASAISGVVWVVWNLM